MTGQDYASIGVLFLGAAYLTLGVAVPRRVRLPRAVTRVLERMPAPRMPRLAKRGSHHRDPVPLRVALGDLVHGRPQMPDDWTPTVFPGGEA